jgi:hypothetical protein
LQSIKIDFKELERSNQQIMTKAPELGQRRIVNEAANSGGRSPSQKVLGFVWQTIASTFA